MSFFTKTVQISALMLTFIVGAIAFTPAVHAQDSGGTWTKRYQKIKGNWSIVETSEGRFLELDDKFKTRNAPDLKLFLSPRAAADVTPGQCHQRQRSDRAAAQVQGRPAL